MIPTMIITNCKRPHGHQSQLHTCPNHFMPADEHIIPPDEVIKEYLSDKEAFKAGWSTTSHHNFSPDGSLIWICPECTVVAKMIMQALKGMGGNK